MREPAPHGLYSPEEAVVLFGGGPVERLCDGQFLVLGEAVVCLVTLGEGPRDSKIEGPSTVTWQPARLDYDPRDEVPWLPAKVREVWSPDRKRKVRQHHVFLRAPGESRYLYAGRAHLGRYGVSPASASFTLAQRLPRESWLRFGGYPGWLVEVNHEDHLLEVGDGVALDRLLAGMLAEEFSHLTITRYEEDSLTLHTNARRGWLMYLREPEDSGMYTRDPSVMAGGAEEFRCGCGIRLEFPVDQTLPRETAMRFVREFFETGQLPAGLPWSE